ncbi:uncharacterized protein LOC144444572 [Glandiceps talaboti]
MTEILRRVVPGIHPLGRLYKRLDDDLSSRDVKRFIMILRGKHLPSRDLEKVSFAADIFHLLEDRGFISVSDLSFLKVLLKEIDRKPLVECVKQCEKELENYTPLGLINSSVFTFYLKGALFISVCSVVIVCLLNSEMFWRTSNGIPTNKPSPPSLNTDNLLAKALQSALGSKGQIKLNERDIMYAAKGRIHSFREPWVYDAWAIDIGSQHKVRVNHFDDEDEAIKEAITKLVADLKSKGLL